MVKPLNERTREHKIGGLLVLGGIALSLTVIGAVVGIPMIHIGYLCWRKGNRFEEESMGGTVEA